MARIVDAPVVTKQTSGATVVPSFGNLVFAANDYILIKVTNRQTTGTSITATGYTKPAGANSRNGNVSECWLYKLAAGGDTAPTINIESAQVIVKVYQIRGADVTTFLSATPVTQNWTTSTSFNQSTYSAGAGDLVIFSASSGTGLLQPRMKIAKCTALNYTAQSSYCDATEAYRQMTSAATTDAVPTYMNASGSGQATVLVIKNESAGIPHVDLRTTISELNWYGLHGATHQAVTWDAPSAFTLKAATALVATKQYEIVSTGGGSTDFTLVGAAANTVGTIFTATGSTTGTGTAAETINGIRVSTTAPTTATDNTVPTNIGNFTRLRSTESTANAWVGGSHSITSADLTGFLFSIQWWMSTSSALSRYGAEGILVGFSDGTNWVLYRIASQDKSWLQTTLDSILVALGNATVYASSGSINLAAATRVAYMWNRAGSSATSDDLCIRNGLLIPTALATTPAYSAMLTGGGAARPATAVDFFRTLTAWDYLGLSTLQGANQVLSKVDCIFGDGTNPTYLDDSAFPVSFPGRYSATRVSDWQMNWNTNENVVTTGIKGASGDTHKLTATTVYAGNEQNFVIESVGTATDVSGLALIQFAPLLSVPVTLANGTVKKCDTLTIDGASSVLTNFSVTTTTSSNAAVAVTGNDCTLAQWVISCVMDSGASTDFHLETGAAVTAIEINATTLSGSPVVSKISSLLMSGELVITVDGSGTSLVAGDVTFPGGSTAFATISAPTVTADASITGMPTAAAATTRLQIINATGAAAAAWTANTSYVTGDVVLRTTGAGTESTAGLFFRCTDPGTSGATEPTWDTTVGNVTTDNTAGWTTYAILFYDADPVTSSYATTYIDGEEFAAGESVEVRFAEMDAATSFKSYSTTTIALAAGFSVLVTAIADPVYATYGLDGSDYDTTYSPDYVLNYLILDTNTDFAGASAFSYFCYLLTGSQGMYFFWGGLTALDPGNIRINDSVLDLYFNESGAFVKQTDDVRIFRDDGARPALDPTTGGYGMEINWRVPVNVVTTGGSAVLPQDVIDIADAVAVVAVDGSTTLAESLRLSNSVLGGKVSGAGTGTETFRDLADTKNRVVSTVDDDGNRTAVTRDLT